jgi:hypothetical protein
MRELLLRRLSGRFGFRVLLKQDLRHLPHFRVLVVLGNGFDLRRSGGCRWASVPE